MIGIQKEHTQGGMVSDCPAEARIEVHLPVVKTSSRYCSPHIQPLPGPICQYEQQQSSRCTNALLDHICYHVKRFQPGPTHHPEEVSIPNEIRSIAGYVQVM